jgi:hypothetical protein
MQLGLHAYVVWPGPATMPMLVWGMWAWIRETQTQTRISADVEYIGGRRVTIHERSWVRAFSSCRGSIAQRRGKATEEEGDIFSLINWTQSDSWRVNWSTTAKEGTSLAGKTTNGRSRSRPALPRIWHACSIHWYCIVTVNNTVFFF